MSAISFRDVWVEYGSQIVLERVNLEIAAGSIVSVVGPSGVGKSTLLRLLLGEERPTRGTILVGGKELPREPGPDRGVVFQRYSVFPHLTVLGNVLVAFEFAGSPLLGRLLGGRRREAIAASEKLVEEVGLKDHRDKFPAALSGGMQQRLALAQAIARRPAVLLLDEPFGALDPGMRSEMHDLVRELWRDCGMTIILVTHDLREAFWLGTRVLTLNQSRVDPQAPGRFGATVTYDLDLSRETTVPVLRFPSATVRKPGDEKGRKG